MAKSAMEALNRRLEEEPGDTNVDIEVIVNADGEAAEDIIEAQDGSEETAEAEAVVENNEEATQEANDMAELAVVLRKYGLTPGMAAIMKVMVPLDACGITMPALESLDYSGRNQAIADRIASRLEAAVESFWDKTKEFFVKMLNQIVRAIQWIWHRLGNIKTRVKRAHLSLQDREWNAELAKDRKFKSIPRSNGSGNDDTASFSGEIPTALAALVTDSTNVLKNVETLIEKDASSTDPNDAAKVLKANLKLPYDEDNLKKGIGYKYKDSNEKKSIESDSSVKFDPKESDVTEAAFKSHQNGNAWKAVSAVIDQIDKLKDAKDAAEKAISKFKDFGGGGDDAASRERISTARSVLGSVSTVVNQSTKMYNKLAMTYVVACSQIRVCTKALKG